MNNLYPREMRELMRSLGEAPFRGNQIFSWIYKGTDLEGMSNIPSSLKEKLLREVSFEEIEKVHVSVSSDGTRKYLFRLPDGNEIESVYMKYSYGASVCISSQAGCAMGCRFCASAAGGLRRNLEAWEMTAQVIAIAEDTGGRIGHVVVMGTGEPFANYGNLARALKLLHDEAGLGISMRNIAVSTCGIVPGMRRFAGDFPQCTLAVSLHAPADALRSEIMPVNLRYPTAEVLKAAEAYTAATRRRVTYEYALISGFNDSMRHADMLADLLRGQLCHVNLIPLNEVEGTGLRASRRAAVFCERLRRRGINATVRRSLGRDIEGACGQLRLKGKRTSG